MTSQPEATLADASLQAEAELDLSHLPANIRQALEDLRAGKPVFIYDADGREEETDIIYWGARMEATSVRDLRQNAGGLVFLLCPHDVAEALDLPFLQDLWQELGRGKPIFEALAPTDIPYDAHSSFSVWINHRGTYTGITDRDRALTISTFARLAQQLPSLAKKSREAAVEAFGAAFRSPGHVPICVAENEPLSRRFGHTELGVALLSMGGMTPVGAGAEMMSDDGGSLEPGDAEKLAKERGLTFLSGAEIIGAWRSQEQQ